MKNRSKTNMKRFVYIFGSCLLALSVTACDVALGPMINMKGPVVTITAPTLPSDQNDITVNTLFTLKGTAQSEDNVALMEIKLDYNDLINKTTTRLGREWRYEGGAWQYKPDSNVGWHTYAEDDYSYWIDPDNPEQPPAWDVVSNTLSGSTVNWSLPVIMDPMDSGYYFFTVSAWDTAGHYDSNSSQKLKVYYVNKQPQLEVLQPRTPVLVPGKLDGTGSLRNPDIPDVLKNYIYDPINLPDETFDYIKNWVSDPQDFQWRINDDPLRTPYTFSLELTNRDHLDIPTPERKVYYRYPDQNGAETITVGSGNFAITGIGEAPYDTAPSSERTYMQLVTRLEDNAGNVQLKSQGFFVYLPDADKPWVDIKFGYKEGLNGQPTPPNAPDQFYVVSGITTPVQSWAYGKNLLDRLEWKLYALQNGSLSPVASGPGSSASPWAGSLDFSADDYYKRNWSFTASPTYGTGRFKIVVTVYDREGNSGEYAAYFTIETNVTPTVKEMDSSLRNNTLFGDSTGIIKFKGTAQIEGTSSSTSIHTASVDRVTIAWIKPNSDPEVIANRQLKYTDRNYANWNKAEASGFFEDSESKVWEIRPGVTPNDVIDFVGPTNNGNGNGQEDWVFSKDLNIFTDLNVGPDKDPSGPQVFLIRVLSGNILGDKSSVYTLNTLGDSSRPEVVITKIFITKYGSFTPVEFSIPLGPSEKLPSLSINDTVRLEGTWTDDSLRAWGGLSETLLHSFFKNFKVTWDGAEIKATLPNANYTVVKSGGIHGEWTTGDYTFTQSNPDAVVQLYAELTDLNNNRGYHGNENSNGDFIEGEQVFLETDNPTLVRISSTTSDGIYGNNKQTDPQVADSHYVDIILEFNKQVKFFDGSERFPPSGTAPRLILNNGGRAFFDYGNGENVLRFRYFIDGVALPSGDPLYLETAVSGLGGGSSPGKLNVTGIEWGSYPQSQWVSVDGGTTQVNIPGDVYNNTSALSLAGGKNIVIDKEPPKITSFFTSASNARPHGIGSSIYITVNFDKTVMVPPSVAAGNFYLNLKGGNLNLPGVLAKASYSNVAGASSVSFLYTVQAGDDTSYGWNGAAAPAENLSIASLSLVGITVTDEAGNALSSSPALPSPGTGALNTDLVIDTSAPNVPTVSGILAQSYYSDQTFTIAGLEGSYVTVEYCLNYDPASPGSAIWTAVPSSYPIVGTTRNNYSVSNIPLNINGSYYIAARQYDNATTPNVSADPTQAQTVGNRSTNTPVRIDKGPLLVRFGSSTPDGIYGYDDGNQIINIDLVFRIPVYVRGSFTIANLALNVKNKSGADLHRTAVLQNLGSHSPDYKTWTFTYSVDSDDLADPLDVTAINLDTLSIYDAPSGGTRVNGVDGWIHLDDVIPSNRFNPQKTITIMTGYPEVTKAASVGTTLDTTHDIAFYTDGDGNNLDFLFNRNIYRGDTNELLVLKQVAAGYRIPAVLSESEWMNRFVNRTDLADEMPGPWGVNSNAKAETWRQIGNLFYQKGTNGATEINTTALSPDPVIKYVLNYAINPLVDTSGVPGYTVGDIKNVLRAAEAVKFDVRDKEVTIESDSQGRPRKLRIALKGDKVLPVKGANYQLTFPKGFVKDFLEMPNGEDTSGVDLTLSTVNADSPGVSGSLAVLLRSGAENPVIRIKKGEDIDDVSIGTGNNRQARQPLLSEARIDCRTPNTTLEYRTRQTTDNVGRLITRANPGNVPNRLPNLGNQTVGDSTSFNAVKHRPQSGATSPNLDTLGLNLWTRMGTYPGSYTSYAAPFVIGTNNYNDGGMEININARVVGTTVQAHEAAFRSVFVFNNTNLNGNRVLNINSWGGNEGNNPQEVFLTEALGRMWIRGGDTANGDTSLPDFPIGRDRTLWKKARLMTPLDVTTALLNGTTAITDSQIPTSFNQTAAPGSTAHPNPGMYLWIWVTWRINIQYTYIDPFCGQLPTAAELSSDPLEAPRYTKDLYMAYVPFKEHYPLIRGRTTVIEPRSVYGNLIDGPNGQLNFGAVAQSPTRRD